MERISNEAGLRDYIRRVLAYMERSEESFDGGQPGEARRLAQLILALVRDTRTTRSALSRLGLKNIEFHDYSPDYNPSIGLPFSGLAIITIGGPVQRYLPRLGKNLKSIRKSNFEKWWTKPVLVDAAKGLNLSREGIVAGVANSNIGAVNSRLTDEFDSLMENVFIGSEDAAEMQPELMEIEFASVRHISYELALSIKEACPGIEHPLN